jgi:hypothetical protein
LKLPLTLWIFRCGSENLEGGAIVTTSQRFDSTFEITFSTSFRSLESNTFYSKDHSWSRAMECLFYVQHLLREILTIRHLYDHSVQLKTFTDHLLPRIDTDEVLDLVSINNQLYSSDIAEGCNKRDR